jgi:RNA polymerase sigma-70 factor (TIGR02952 family)
MGGARAPGSGRPGADPAPGSARPAATRPTPFPRTAEPARPSPTPRPRTSGNGDATAVAAAVHPPADGPDVWALVHRAQRGDAEAFGQIYDHYVGMVHRYVHHRLGDRVTAEDVTSETFVRALRRIDSLTFQGRDVAAWLLTIARNIVLDHVKSSRYRLEVSTADMRDADTSTDGPEDAVVQRLTNQELVACIRELGPEQQECLALRFLHGLSVSETAQVMGKRDGAVKALQHRAVRRLARLLPDGLR